MLFRSKVTVSNGIEKKIKIGFLKNENICNLIKMIDKAMINTQALNVPCDTCRFVIFENKKTDTFFKAVWNPKFHTLGNIHFREVYDSLELYKNLIKN